ncbi:MAG TPA: c-type cytochrome domain-containing protein, partial [Polyangiaceae bacterium]|nr:c-type cytochrome domain-containing protein [Polyangiaceae bacterium]
WLETRFLVAARNGRYYGVTYKWNEEETDALPLLESQEEVLDIIGPDGVARQQTYFYPGPADCLICHTAEAGYVLGVRTAQLNGPRAGAAASASQLVDWAARGLLDTPIDDQLAASLPRLSPLTDETRPIGERLRSYWDSNCSMCHGRVAGIRATWDARLSTPLESQGIIGGELSGEAELPEGSVVIAPGDLEHSAMWQRAISTDPALRMPPVGRRTVDAAYVQLLEQWIASL